MTVAAGLLNPPVEAAVCKRMIGLVEGQKQALEAKVTSQVTSESIYLQNMGRIDALREALKELKMIYEREFEV